MNYQTHNYRYAEEIIHNIKYSSAWNEIEQAITECPLYVWPMKSKTNSKLDVVQQLLNVYFERRFHIDFGWDYHPNATAIDGSELKADFRKAFGDLVIQTEVQFGNMSRWYSDIFKFQAGYSGKQVRMGVSILPDYLLARRIDSNIAHYERAIRELPSAEFSITLPILTIGLSAPVNTSSTQIIDVSKSKFSKISDLTGRGQSDNRWRMINNVMLGVPIEEIGPDSPVGPSINSPVTDEED